MKMAQFDAKSGLPDVHIFKPKIPIRENFVGSCNGRCWQVQFISIWSTLMQFSLFYGQLLCVGMLWFFGTFFKFWYVAPRKSGSPAQNTATCEETILVNFKKIRRNLKTLHRFCSQARTEGTTKVRLSTCQERRVNARVHMC
jgi:hypothetical protein